MVNKNIEQSLTTGFMRLPQVLALIPVSKSTWPKLFWRSGCKKGIFPKPIKLSARTTVWRVEDITEFIKRVGLQAEKFAD